VNARLDVMATLTAAAPKQRLRRTRATAREGLQIRRADFRVRRFKERSQSVTIFLVDASGSQALYRLAEAKGAVELLLVDCYVRRDRVALLTFRGSGAQLLLPPTRSLVRAKRGLAALPGGGGTPLAAGLTAATELAVSVRRLGDSPRVVLMTDGRANVTLGGRNQRLEARAEALRTAGQFRAMHVPAVVIDTATRPSPEAEVIAQALGARYFPLPHAQAASLASAARLGMHA
jgi:magnesium chelatase subunit D